MQWNKKFKTQAPAGKVMLTIFWDDNGPILLNFQEKGQTVTSARYSDMLMNELKPAIWSKRRGLLSKRVSLLHDIARPNTPVHTVDTLHALKFDVLKHPPYRPDLAPSLSLVWTYERTFAGPEVCRYQQGNGGSAKLVKGHAKSFFSGGHPQACGQVDQVCSEAGGLSKNKAQTISISTLVKKVL